MEIITPVITTKANKMTTAANIVKGFEWKTNLNDYGYTFKVYQVKGETVFYQCDRQGYRAQVMRTNLNKMVEKLNNGDYSAK